jgi:hypothetical protein
MRVRYKLHEPARAGRARHNGTALRTFRTRGPRSDDLLARIIVDCVENEKNHLGSGTIQRQINSNYSGKELDFGCGIRGCNRLKCWLMSLVLGNCTR